MAFFRTAAFAEIMPAIENERVVLRPPQMADFAEWAALRERSRAFLKPWEPVWPVDDLTRGAFRRRLKRYAEDQRADQSYSFFIFAQAGRRTGRRHHAGECAPRRRPGRQYRLLDR